MTQPITPADEQVLEPCPFCGEIPRGDEAIFEADDIGGWLAGCCAQTWGNTRAEAIAAWNQRTRPSPVVDGALVATAAAAATYLKRAMKAEAKLAALSVKDAEPATRPSPVVDGLSAELAAVEYEWRGPFGREKHRIVPPALFDRILTALAMRPAPETTAPDDVVDGLEDALAAAYTAGATDVHEWWVAGNVEREADFGEAASDYARSIDLTALSLRPAPETTASDDVVEVVGYRWRVALEGCPDEHSRWVLTEFLPEFDEKERVKVTVEPLFAKLPKPTEQATSPAPDAVLREALERIQDEANTVCGDWRETASMIDSICTAALASSKPTGEGEAK